MENLWYMVDDSRTDMLAASKGICGAEKSDIKRHHNLPVADSLVDHSIANWQHIPPLLFL